ncbi:integron [Aureimonas sp. ME7]|uniref:integron n=1 Tax=Aureimonas sp. ME7 TaxID=2744252 RepID=UPI0015FDE513|nr:integron [Aureimonas sp. ME7]
MKLTVPLLCVATLLAWLPSPNASAQSSVRVEIGGDAEFDACRSFGRIVGLDPTGDNFLSVRDGPNSGHQERDRLGAGALVAICDERGPWLGVVYPAPGTQTDCGVSSPQTVRTPYRGPCRSGWVHGHFVDVIAG